jgi:hypothetical protein
VIVEGEQPSTSPPAARSNAARRFPRLGDYDMEPYEAYDVWLEQQQQDVDPPYLPSVEVLIVLLEEK